MSTTNNELLSELQSGVLTLTMNRPKVHNAFDSEQIIRLTNALLDAEKNDQVRIIIIAGVGKSFCAGGDLNYMRSMGTNTYEENQQDAGRLARLMNTLNFLNKPTIARVQGAAFGGGVGLVSCCDIAIGNEHAKLSLSEVKVGMVPATISPYVVRAIGERAARHLFITGELINAQRAYELGLLSEIVGGDELDTAVERVCTTLLNNAPNGISLSKKLVFQVSQGDIDTNMIEKTVKLIADVRDSDEGREGLSAFLDKRKPNWVTE